VVGDGDMQRRNEADQTARGAAAASGKRARPEPDTVSEQGDTDRYLKNMAADSERQAEMRARGHVPRQSSVVVTHNGTPAKDLRGLWLEVQVLQQQQQHLEVASDEQKRSSMDCEKLLGCAPAALLLCTVGSNWHADVRTVAKGMLVMEWQVANRFSPYA
jgi:hypothetical protein